jgi:hypothetical protein
LHILDEAKRNWTEECPNCEKKVNADQLTITSHSEGILFFHCGCGWHSVKKISLDTAVDRIGE